ncbi:glycoside hydrolase family 2 protein [Marinimicrobium alkaliphilum]|uniref:glycoside hydrolase family 2 protein n=1 Tax=Marinimicrobium alkaliphilum TaxID=2202654 RepID=UPI000DB901A6|nr:glycoside hydrolase family 2 TIM barrel-domain containing protein [Marinimicrobium alkaliphilum]
MINLPGRTTTSLNGLWEVIIDPFDAGKGSWIALYQDRKPESDSDFVEYGFDGGPRLHVPGDFNSQMPELAYYEGTLWYKRQFEYTPSDKRLFVHFGAINYRASIYLNGEFLGEHEGGFTPFQIELTDRVIKGENSLIVRANNERIRDGIPGLGFDWFNYGGITRDVDLVETPATYIKDYKIQLKRGDLGTIAGWVQLDGANLRQTIRLSIPEAGIDKTFRTDSKGRAEINLPAELALWSPENPKLYDVQIASATDSTREKIGFRTIEVEGKEILLNGQPIFLRGINIHEEIPQRKGRAFSEADAQMLLGWAKELNSNFVRLSHYPHNEHMVRLADELGLLVWSEVPVYQHIDFASPVIQRKMDLMIREMISRDKNRSSVIIWSAANETYPSPERNAAIARLSQLVRSLDSTRLVAQASNTFEYHDDRTEITDAAFEHFDLVAINQYFGWYRPWPEQPGVMKWVSDFDKPLIISEFGGEALLGSTAEPKHAAHSWSEEYHEDIHIQQVKMFDSMPELRGVVPWILVDFRSPTRMHPVHQQGWNRKGLLSDRGLKKKAWYIMRDYYDRVQKDWEAREHTP